MNHYPRRGPLAAVVLPFLRPAFLRPAFLGSALLALVTLAALGCSDPEPIRVYSIDHRPPAVLQSSMRMLGAIVPQEQDNWFFKVRGPENAIEAVKDEVRAFVAAVSFENGEPALEQLPAGWERISPGSGPVPPHAKILIESEDSLLELTITKLSRRPDWDVDVQENVNRWRGQMGLAPLDSKWAGAEPLDGDDQSETPRIWVDLIEEDDAGGSMATMTPPALEMPQSADAPPAAETPETSDSSETSEAPADNGLSYDAPEGWREGRRGGMRLATLDVGEGEQAVEVTMIRAGGDLRANVGMWAGQVAGEAADEAMIEAAMGSAEELTVDGQPAKRLFLAGEGEQALAIDIVIVESPDQLPLFIKMKGNKAAVEMQHDAMTELIESLRLSGETAEAE